MDPPEPVPVGTIVGRVADDVRSRPGVTVTLSRAGAALVTTVTNQRGEFEFRDLDPGEYTVSISGVTEWGCATQRIAMVPAGEGTNANFLCLTPLRRGTIVGTVTVNGFVASEIVVTLRSGSEVRTRTTGWNGEYFFGGVGTGSHSVSVESSNLRCAPESVAVPPDGGTRADIPCAGQVVRGKLTVNGLAIGGSTVALCEGTMRDEADCDRLTKPTGLEGRFTYTDLATGHYYVFLESYNHGPGVVCPIPDPVAVPADATVFLDLICMDDNPWDY